MKKTFFGICAMGIALSALAAGSASRPISVSWEAHNLPANEKGNSSYLQTFTVKGDVHNVKRLCFNSFQRWMKLEDPRDTLVELVPGYFAIASPRFAEAKPGEELKFNITTGLEIWGYSYGPDGMHTVNADGSMTPIKIKRHDWTAEKSHYATEKRDRLEYGDKIFDINENINKNNTPKEYDVVPSFKNVELKGNKKSLVNPAKAQYIDTDFSSTDGKDKLSYYTIEVQDGKMTVRAPKAMWPQLQARIKHFFGNKPVMMGNAVITDYAVYPYRGIMLDVVRNFQSAKEIHRILDLMAAYNLNVLHFHIADDEAWRYEVPAIPELNTLASRRGYTSDPNAPFLAQTYTGDGNPDAKGGTGSGYYTRQEFKDILQHAAKLGITVLPEIEAPGHARAAIKAMAAYERRTGDSSMTLHEKGDTSKYTSAQAYHDCVMNPAIPGPYKFMEVIADDLAALYKEAGLPLPVIHIGGDEVPKNAWGGSPAVQALMKEKGFTSEKQVHAMFVRKIADIYAKKGIQIAGWQEIARGHGDEFNNAVRPNTYSVNMWSTLPAHGESTAIKEVVEAGFPIVLSNVNHFYFDLMYSYNPEERGLLWGGTTDEFASLSGYPDELCKTPGANILGVSGQVWSETIRGPQDMERLLLPKMLGLAERGWNGNKRTYSEAELNGLIQREMPKWDAAKYTYHVRQAGIKATEDGKVLFNSPYAKADIYYTLDGSLPTTKSAKAIPGKAVDAKGAKMVRAVLYTNGHRSPVTVLYLNK